MKKVSSSFIVIVIIAMTLTASLLRYNTYASSEDPVYDSMTLPSESQSDYMISVNRNYGKILDSSHCEKAQHVLSFGGLYPTSAKTLPKKFNVYLGKITLYAFSKSNNCWVIIDDHPCPTGAYVYTLPWETTKVKECTKVTKHDDYLEITLTAEEMQNCVLHFWGSAVPKKSDYLFYACSYDFWSDKSSAGKLTATIGIDAKDSDHKEYEGQLFSSRGLSSSTEVKTHWGHTVPIKDYYKYFTYQLNDLYKNGIITTQSDDTDSDDSKSKSVDPIPVNPEPVPSTPEPVPTEPASIEPDPVPSNPDPIPNIPDVVPSENKKDSQDSSKTNKNADTTITNNVHVDTSPSTLKKTTFNKMSKASTHIVLEWRKAALPANGYQIQYSIDKNFKKNVKKIYIGKRSTLKTTLIGLKPRQTYYLRIRAMKKTGKNKIYSKWSKKAIIKTN